MEEKDLQRIEQMIGKAMKAEVAKAVKSEIQAIDINLTQLRKDINDDFRHHVGILTDNFNHKLQLVGEGHQMLSEKIDDISGKIDSVAADLAAHRADTEGHKRGYIINEP